MSRTRLTCAGMCLALLLASACSDDGGSKKAKHKSTTTSTTSTTVAPAGTTAPTGTGPGSHRLPPVAVGTTAPTTVAPAGTTAPTGTGPGSHRLPPVAVGTTAPLGSNLFVTVTKIQPVELQAHGIGETKGPGVLVTAVLRNDTGATIDTTGMAINAHYGSGVPAPPSESPPAKSFSGTLASGQSATGTYAFRVPANRDGSVVIDLQHSGAPNVVIVDATK